MNDLERRRVRWTAVREAMQHLSLLLDSGKTWESAHAQLTEHAELMLSTVEYEQDFADLRAAIVAGELTEETRAYWAERFRPR